MKTRGIRQQLDKPNEDALYLDSQIISKCGMFYIAVTKGRVFATLPELEAFNKTWCQKIKQEMHYDKYYLAFGIEESLEFICERSREDFFVLTNEGIATMLSEVQRYARSKMNVKNFIIILDKMIKDELSRQKKDERQAHLEALKSQIEKLFEIESLPSFSTQEEPSVLAIRILLIMAEIYAYETYRSISEDSTISDLVSKIKEQEKKYKELISNSEKAALESQKFLQVAKQIREGKIVAYRAIYESMIHKMEETELKRNDI